MQGKVYLNSVCRKKLSKYCCFGPELPPLLLLVGLGWGWRVCTSQRLSKSFIASGWLMPGHRASQKTGDGAFSVLEIVRSVRQNSGQHHLTSAQPQRCWSGKDSAPVAEPAGTGFWEVVRAGRKWRIWLRIPELCQQSFPHTKIPKLSPKSAHEGL